MYAPPAPSTAVRTAQAARPGDQPECRYLVWEAGKFVLLDVDDDTGSEGIERSTGAAGAAGWWHPTRGPRHQPGDSHRLEGVRTFASPRVEWRAADDSHSLRGPLGRLFDLVGHPGPTTESVLVVPTAFGSPRTASVQDAARDLLGENAAVCTMADAVGEWVRAEYEAKDYPGCAPRQVIIVEQDVHDAVVTSMFCDPAPPPPFRTGVFRPHIGLDVLRGDSRWIPGAGVEPATRDLSAVVRRLLPMLRDLAEPERVEQGCDVLVVGSAGGVAEHIATALHAHRVLAYVVSPLDIALGDPRGDERETYQRDDDGVGDYDDDSAIAREVGNDCGGGGQDVRDGDGDLAWEKSRGSGRGIRGIRWVEALLASRQGPAVARGRRWGIAAMAAALLPVMALGVWGVISLLHGRESSTDDGVHAAPRNSRAYDDLIAGWGQGPAERVRVGDASVSVPGGWHAVSELSPEGTDHLIIAPGGSGSGDPGMVRIVVELRVLDDVDTADTDSYIGGSTEGRDGIGASSPVRDRILAHLASELGPPGRQWSAGGQRSGVPVVARYREEHHPGEVDWTIVVAGQAQVSVGCQSRPGAEEEAHRLCDAVVGSLEISSAHSGTGR